MKMRPTGIASQFLIATASAEDCRMNQHTARLLVANEWRESSEGMPVTDPFTGQEFARVPLGDDTLLQEAIEAADAAFRRVRRTPPHERSALLAGVARGIEARRSEFCDTIVREAGKPITFAEAEVARAIVTFTAASEEARRTPGELLDLDAFAPGQAHFGLARRLPLGVIGAITPFNFPLNLVAHKVAPCLATNNTMVLKPASKTPLSALLLAEVLVEAGLPAGQVNVVTCTNEVVSRLVTDDRVKKISFTGSPAVGWQLKEKCGRKRITLELGGNAGVIVHTDADLTAAIPAIATGGFGQAGQSCIAVQRIVLQESIYEEFRSRFLAHVRDHVKAGDPRERTTLVGPMITGEALEKVEQRIAQALAAGARLLCGGKRSGPCLEPTVLEDVSSSLEIVAQEVFAPVVTLHRYGDFEAALALINDSVFGLQAGVFTRDVHLIMRAFESLEVGGVLINQVPTWRVENMPYGGIKDSGFGREGIRYAMEEMTELKSLIVNCR